MESNGKRFNLKIGVDGDIFFCYGSGFVNLQESACGYGLTLEQAVSDYLNQYNQPQKYYRMVDDPNNPGLQMFEEVNLP